MRFAKHAESPFVRHETNSSTPSPASAAIRRFEWAHVEIPIVVGVTGHRDIREEDKEKLQQKIRDILTDLGNRYPATPIVLLSALAEGADRLAARAALSVETRVQLFVPLPLPRHLYERDFCHLSYHDTKQSLLEFRELIRQADGSFELPLAEGNTLEGLAEDAGMRDHQYDMVGRYISQESQILIALWDGLETGLVGGTSSVVRYQTEGVPSSNPFVLDTPEGFPAYHILTPRRSCPYPEGELFGLRKIYPTSFQGDARKAKRYYHRMFSRIDEFNRRLVYRDHKSHEGAARSKKRLLRNVRGADFGAAPNVVLDRYAMADALAIRLREKMVSTERLLHALVFFAFLFFALFAHISPRTDWLLVASVCLSVGAVICFYAGRDSDTNYEDYRAMAEGLRVKFFWRVSGIADSVSDHYLGKQRTELDWIRNALRGWEVLEDSYIGAKASLGMDPMNRILMVRKYWIEDQQRYFNDAAHREERTAENLDHLASFPLVAATIPVILLLFPSLIGRIFFPLSQPQLVEWLESILIVLIEVMLAGSALLHHYNNRMAHKDHAKQYRRMAAVFTRALHLISPKLPLECPEDAQSYFRRIGKEALAENGDWVLLHRERPLEVPHP
jgi:hypothetical protein